MSALAVVPARGGSKGVRNKNLALAGGKPLICWTLEAALSCPAVDRVIVTTDSQAIMEVAAGHGADVPFRRPAQLALDESPSIDAVLHAVEWLDEHQGYRPDIVIALQPTSPLRTAADVSAALELCHDSSSLSVVSVTAATEHPHWMNVLDADGYLRDFLPNVRPASRRQDLPIVYAQNGAIALAHRDALLRSRNWFMTRTRAYVMPAERSLDIDSPWQLHLADLILTDIAAAKTESKKP